ncbi:MAG: RNA-binding S4 domain-containing protein [Oscillospiraceae bacterium]|jgi:ribosome-associated protein|nr:RNA-binding S4 domain-containing protein [Oscillospiraceae bacterium]
MKLQVTAAYLPQEPRTVAITGEYIKLESLLKFANIVETGGEAKKIILAGRVRVNGEVAVERGKKIRVGDVVIARGEQLTVDN